MKDVIERNPSLSLEERNVLSTSFKNLCGESRDAWKAVVAATGGRKGEREGEATGGRKGEREGEIRAKAAEVEDICSEALSLVKEVLLPAAKDKESKAFFLTMMADYNRYQLEVTPQDDSSRSQLLSDSERAYERAFEISKQLPTTHPVRLGVALNYSVFQQEILNKPDLACETAKGAFDNAIQELDTLSEDTYKDSTLVMQLLRDNLTLWTEEEREKKEKQMEEER